MKSFQAADFHVFELANYSFFRDHKTNSAPQHGTGTEHGTGSYHYHSENCLSLSWVHDGKVQLECEAGDEGNGWLVGVGVGAALGSNPSTD